MHPSISNFDVTPLRARAAELSAALQEPTTLSDQRKFTELNIEFTKVRRVIDSFDRITGLSAKLTQAQELSNDPEMQPLADKEIRDVSDELEKEAAVFEQLTLPSLPDDERPALMEFRAGTGGVEAALFCEETMHSYLKYLTRGGFQPELSDVNYQTEGGIKEATISVNAPGSFGHLRFESGVHRVQRVPATESAGRIHTSAISIVVLPQVEAKDVQISESDLKIDVYRSSGPGGQSVNTTDSAVRITHLPTGITVSCQDGKSQHKNKDKAMSILAAKLYNMQQESSSAETQILRKLAIQSGDRSAKIRTYNFPQTRVTDHRTHHTWHSLAGIMSGELDELITQVNNALRAEIYSQGE